MEKTARPKKATPARDKALSEMEQRLEKVEAELKALSARMEAFETTAPSDFRKLPPDTVEEILKEDKFAEFEALEDYKHVNIRIRKGQAIRADRVNHLMTHVRNGLLLARPSSSDAILSQYREEVAMRERAARAAKAEAAALAQLEATKAAASEED